MRDADTRTFQRGEPVCIRQGERIISGKYLDAIFFPDFGRIAGHGVTFDTEPERVQILPWTVIGKLPIPVSKTALRKLFDDKNLPYGLDEHMIRSRYGGKRKTRKTKKRRATRRRR